MDFTVWIGVLILIFLLIVGVPVALAFGFVVIFYTWTLGYTNDWMLTTSYDKIKSILLLTIPMFILAGDLMAAGRIGAALVDWLETIFGRIKACMMLVGPCACGIFGSVCGSGAATLTCIGSILAPRMKEKGYPMGVVAAMICCSAPLGLLIPPSGTQIMVAWSANISVLSCFCSTVVPGIILMSLLAITSWFLVRKAPTIAPGEKLGIRKWTPRAVKTTGRAIPALVMPVIILGGIYGGFMTPTESASVAGFYSIPVAFFIYKGMTLKNFGPTVADSATTSGVCMLLIVFVSILSRILVLEDLPTMILDLFMKVSDNPWVILMMMNVLMIIIGMIMDDVCGVLLVTPILMPVVKELGFSPYHFAAIIGVNLGMGNITPPCAPFIFMSARVCKVDTVPMLKPIFIMLGCCYLPTLLLTTFIPKLSLFTPQLVLGDKFNYAG